MRNWIRETVFICILISLFIHISVWMSLRMAKAPPPKPKKIEVTILDKSPVSAKKPVPQIVQQPDKAINDEINPNAKYLSAHNQSVVHETRAKNVGEFRNTAGTGQNHLQSHATPKVASRSKGSRAKSHVHIHDHGSVPTLADLSPKFDPSQAPQVDDTDVGNGQAPSQTDDFLKNTPPSLETLLNTKEFVYYTYYQRIRARIRQYWAPCIRKKVQKIFASGRSIASDQDHITRVIIVLDRNGNLVKVEIVGISGIRELDDAAVEAFRQAAPFPHPPKGIVGPDGYIRINWSFILQADNQDPLVLQDLYAKDE